MELKFQLHADRSRFGIILKCDEFDGHPGLDEVWFDGINEPPEADIAALAGWLLAAPFVSQKVRLSVKPTRPLVNKLLATWGAPLEMGPVDDEPRRFPPRTGTLFVAPLDPANATREDQPGYELRLLPLNASGTTYTGAEIAAKTNVVLLGQGLLTPNFSHIIAQALVYADFLGIGTIVVPAGSIDVPPPMKRRHEVDDVLAWRELLKAAGLNLRVQGESK